MTISSKDDQTHKELAYDRISDDWENFISHYDENRRMEVLIDDFLGATAITNKSCLDVGCGLGYFSSRISRYKPDSLYSCDISPKLVEKLSQKHRDIHCLVANVLELSSVFKKQNFEVVVCSEVIEHTIDPYRATMELAKIVAPGGYLAISVPNQHWHWLLDLAQITKIRTKYQGYENWVLPAQLQNWLISAGMEIIRSEGVHTIPFPLCPKGLLRKLDQKLRKSNYSYALNLAVLAKKKF